MDGSHSPAAAVALPVSRSEPLVSPTSLLGAAFVILWSTGYIAGKIGLAHSGPFDLLLVRFAGAALAFAALAAVARAGLPGWRTLAHSAVVGVLSLALQFGGMYVGLSWGAEIGVAALMTGSMPLVTAAFAPWFGERVTSRQWIGLGLGLGGVVLVLADRLQVGGAPVAAYLALIVSLLGVSLGTLYQKRHASTVDARVGLAVQHAVAAVVLIPLVLHEGLTADLSAAFFASAGWLIAVNALGGFGLLFVLLRRGAANKVAQLFFLIPPVTAAMSHLWFGEEFTGLKLAGFVVAAAGVWLGTHAPARR